MRFTNPNLPAVEPESFLRLDYGFGAPRMIHVLYIAKLVFFYALGGIAIATVTSGLPALRHVSQWWDHS
jgi:hypothetical protein